MARVVRRRSKTTPRVKGGRVQRKNYRDVDWKPGGPLTVRTEVPGPGFRHILTRELVERFIEIVPDWDVISRGLEEIVLSEGNDGTDGWYFDGTLAVSAWRDPPAITVGPQYYAEHRAIWERLSIPQRPDPIFLGAVYGTIDGCWVDDPLETLLMDSFNEVYGFKAQPQGEGQWAIVDNDRAPGTLLAEVIEIDHQFHVYEACVLMRFDRKTAAAFQLLHIFLHELGHHIDAITRPHPGWIVRGEEYAEGWADRCAVRIWDEALALLR